ncbi:MAG: hypothetical protein ACSW8G_04670 [Bacillota bacterium]
MSIVKTIYSKDKKHRAHIRRREDGLIDVISDELVQDYYVNDSEKTVRMDDYYWQDNNGISSCITDSIAIAEEVIRKDFCEDCIEAPIVDVFCRVILQDGRKGRIVDIAADGDYIVKIDGGKHDECVPIQDIKQACEYDNSHWIICESKNYYIKGEYEYVGLYHKKGDTWIADVGDFYGEPRDGIIDWNELFCVTVGCGLIIYYFEEPFDSYSYHYEGKQWYEAGRDSQNIKWIERVWQVSDDTILMVLEDGSKETINVWESQTR